MRELSPRLVDRHDPGALSFRRRCAFVVLTAMALALTACGASSAGEPNADAAAIVDPTAQPQPALEAPAAGDPITGSEETAPAAPPAETATANDDSAEAADGDAERVVDVERIPDNLRDAIATLDADQQQLLYKLLSYVSDTELSELEVLIASMDQAEIADMLETMADVDQEDLDYFEQTGRDGAGDE